MGIYDPKLLHVVAENDRRGYFCQKIGNDVMDLNEVGNAMLAWRISGACYPTIVQAAIGIEPRVGAMLLYNVIIREVKGGIEVCAIDPVAPMQAIENAKLTAVSGEVRELLSNAVEVI